MKKLVAVLFLAVLISCTQKTEVTEGIIDAMVGTVYINGVSAELETVVKDGDTVETEADSYCDIIFADKNIFRVTENTGTVINLEENRIKINNGMVGFVLGNVKEETFEVETTTAIAAIKGTVFFINVESPDQTYFCTCNGTIEYLSGEDWDTNISANHHTSLRLKRNEDGSLERLESGMEFHTDEDMNILDEKVGMEIDWESTDGLHDQ